METNEDIIKQQHDFSTYNGPDDNDTCPGVDQTTSLNSLRAVYLRNLPRNLTQVGVKNLCGKYGLVEGIRMYDEYKTNCALVFFATQFDAEHCIRNINNNSTGIVASAKTDKIKDDQTEKTSSLSEEEPIVQAINDTNCNRKVNSLSSKPMKLTSFAIKPLLSNADYVQSDILKICDPHMDFLNESNNIVLAEDLKNERITNGRSQYRHPTEIKNKIKNQHEKSQGTLDMKKQEFVHIGGNYVSEAGACICCGITTITFCDGCLEFYCCHQCWVKMRCNCQKKIISGREEKSNDPRSNAAAKVNEANSEGTSMVKMSSRLKILQRCHKAERLLCEQRTISGCEIPSNNTLVVITTVIDHTRVFLRSKEPNDNDEYLKFLNDVAEYSKIARTLKEMPEKDDIVLAEFEDAYYRALVVRIEEDMVVVAYLEFGNLGKKSLSDLKELRDDLRFKKRFTFKVCLTGIDGYLLNDKALAYLYNLLDGEIPLKFIRQDDTFSSKGVLCELVENASNENINRKIATLNTVNSMNSVKNESHVFTTLIGENAQVIVLDNENLINGYVTVIQKDNVQKLIKIQQRISEYCKQDYKGEYTAINNEICLAKYDGYWYRVMLVKASGDGNPLMNLIDFGISAHIDLTNMRRMPSEFYYPCYAVFAKIGGIPKELTKEQHDKLMQHYPVESTVIVAKCELRESIDLGDDEDIPIIYFKDLKI